MISTDKIVNFKNKLFYHAVESNPRILSDYQKYKWAHTEKKENKLKSWSYIFILNFLHRTLKINTLIQNSSQIIKTEKGGSMDYKKLPYLDGPESEISNRVSITQLAKKLMKHEVISFDVFDTLILRPFAKPEHLFFLLGNKHKQINFLSIRVEAEKEARNIAFIKKGNREVTIYDIYEIIERKTGIKKEYGVQVEIETELKICAPNPYMREIFEILKSKRKRIVAISDMYVTKEMLIEFLNKCGYFGFEDVFISSENNCSKRTKGLFMIALNKLKIDPIDMVHVGDNFQTDIKAANSLNINTVYYKNVNDIGNDYRTDGMSELIGSTYSGIVNSHLHNGDNVYTPYYEFGFTYGGIYILGFCNWIYEFAKKNDIDKILFLSRDGEIYKQVFDYLYPGIQNEYVYWSRIANTKYTVEKNREDFITRMIYHKSIGVIPTSLKSMLDSLDLTEMLRILPYNGLKEEEIIHKGNVKIVEDFFIDHWECVVENLSVNNEIVKQYILSKVGSSKKVAVVDVGWIGSGGLGLKYLIEEKWGQDCKVFSLIAASRYWNHTANINEIMNGETIPYIFSRMYNRNLYDTHSNTNKNSNNIFFELFTQACYPSFSGFKRNESGFEFLFDVPEVENYEYIKEVHQGIFDFVKKYNETFKDFKYLSNISGYDAYIPFRFLIKDLKFIKKYFGQLRYSRGVLADSENQTFETLNDILESAGV
ncbi:HAD-IA family hydrolase [Paenibacillus sp. HB172176]|uniref:HAD family hydrolase n=1 Tax=Paenibacillus sp. HB172176 TaxID=2493690 RepID=UPI00143C8B05|nr:HAD-IA family hydrolase [Paenibacillus sp. HB172176]